MPLRLDNRDAAFAAAFDALLDQKREEDRNVDAIAADILENVRKNGDAALLDYTAKFDRLTLDSADKLRLTDDEIQAAIKTCEPDTLDALKIAARRIEDYHRKQFPEDAFYEDALSRMSAYMCRGAGRPIRRPS